METRLEKKITGVLVSPCRIDIMNQLADSNGLEFRQIKDQMIAQSAGLNDHLERLLKDDLIKFNDDKYYLTNEGKEIYKILQQIVLKASTRLQLA